MIYNHCLKIIFLTILALFAFAANSVLCKFALTGNEIDAAGFTIIRLLSGAIVLFIILQFNKDKSKSSANGSWTAGLMLFLYAVTFSYAYVSLETGTGALILFGAVQITMFFWSILKGHRLHILEWTGALAAFAGFLYLILPGVTAPSSIGFILMTTAGISWGIYSLLGHNSKNPFLDTSFNFFRTIPLVFILLIFTLEIGDYSNIGILLAVLSGGIASGIGYAIWYLALMELTSIQAAVVQLFVPVIAAFGGVLFISEVLTLRLIISTIFILGGILLIILSGKQKKV